MLSETKDTCLICDCDGVLIDSEVISSRQEAEVLQSLGLSLSTEDVIRRFTGYSQKDIRRIIEHDFLVVLPDNFEKIVSSRLNMALAEELVPIPGVKEALMSLRLQTCVASSSSLARLQFTLNLAGLFDFFQRRIFSSSQVARGKPAPDLFLFAAREMGYAPAHCIVVEDSVAGVTAATSAGMTAIGFVGGSHCQPGDEARLRAAGASRVVSSWHDLLHSLNHADATFAR